MDETNYTGIPDMIDDSLNGGKERFGVECVAIVSMKF